MVGDGRSYEECSKQSGTVIDTRIYAKRTQYNLGYLAISKESFMALLSTDFERVGRFTQSDQKRIKRITLLF